MQMRLARLVATAGLLASCLPAQAQDDSRAIAADCLKLVRSGPRPLAETRTERFEGKVGEPAAACRGGEKSVARRGVPWVDWSNYWGAGDASSKTDARDRIACCRCCATSSTATRAASTAR